MALMKEQNGEDCGKWRRLYFKVVKLRGGASPQILKRILLPVYGTVQVSQNKTTTSDFSY